MPLKPYNSDKPLIPNHVRTIPAKVVRTDGYNSVEISITPTVEHHFSEELKALPHNKNNRFFPKGVDSVKLTWTNEPNTGVDAEIQMPSGKAYKTHLYDTSEPLNKHPELSKAHDGKLWIPLIEKTNLPEALKQSINNHLSSRTTAYGWTLRRL